MAGLANGMGFEACSFVRSNTGQKNSLVFPSFVTILCLRPRNSCRNTVFNSRGKRVGPLRNGLWPTADCCRCFGGCTAKEIYCVLFDHSQIVNEIYVFVR